jgi:hypothetical protein
MKKPLGRGRAKSFLTCSKNQSQNTLAIGVALVLREKATSTRVAASKNDGRGVILVIVTAVDHPVLSPSEEINHQ